MWYIYIYINQIVIIRRNKNKNEDEIMKIIKGLGWLSSEGERY